MNRRELLAVGLAGASLTACAKTDVSAIASAPLSPENTHTALSAYAVNVESWWRDKPFETRFDIAAKSGFSDVEFWFIDSWNRRAAELNDILALSNSL